MTSLTLLCVVIRLCIRPFKVDSFVQRYSRAYFTRPSSSCHIDYYLILSPGAPSSIIYLIRYSSLKTLILMMSSSLLRVVISTDDYQYQNINRLVESSSSHEALNRRHSQQIPHAQTTSLEDQSCQGSLSCRSRLFF